MRLQEGQKIKSSSDAIDLLNNGKLAGMLGGAKYIPNWLKEQPELFEAFVDATLALADENNPNLAIDDTIKFLIKFSKTPDLWEEAIEKASDTIITLFSAFATQWFKEATWQTLLNKILSSNTFVLEDWHNLEKSIQDMLAKRQAKKGKITKNAESNLYDTLYDDGTWKLFVPKCFEGDSVLASHIKPFIHQGDTYNKTRWCTAADAQYWDRYSSKGKLYVIQYWENGEYTEAWQVWFDDEIDFLDKADVKNQKFAIDNAPDELLAKIPVENKENIYNGKTLLDLVKLLKEEAPEETTVNYLYGEEYILRKTSPELFTKNTCFWYKSVLRKGDLLTTEKHIVFPTLNDDSWRTKSIPVDFCKGLQNIESIEIQEGYDGIDDEAFEGCTNLKTVIIHGKPHLDKRCFKNCTSLETVITDDDQGLNTDSSAFEGCTNLREIKSKYIFPNAFAFKNCKSLEYLPGISEFSYIQKSLFEGCENLKEVTISLTDWKADFESSCFKDCRSLKKIVLRYEGNKEDSKTYELSADIGAFENCKNLEEIITPDGDKQSLESILPALSGTKLVSKIPGAYVISSNTDYQKFRDAAIGNKFTSVGVDEITLKELFNKWVEQNNGAAYSEERQALRFFRRFVSLNKKSNEVAIAESTKRPLTESTKVCEDESDIEDLWYQIATRAKNHLHDEIAGLSIVEEELNPKTLSDPNPIAETRAEIVDGDLFVDIHVDPAFYDLKAEWQAAVIVHEMGHAEDIYRLYDKLLKGEATVEDWKKKANPAYSNGGHDLDWKQVTRELAMACGVKADMALLTVIDFTDDTLFQAAL